LQRRCVNMTETPAIVTSVSGNESYAAEQAQRAETARRAALTPEQAAAEDKASRFAKSMMSAIQREQTKRPPVPSCNACSSAAVNSMPPLDTKALRERDQQKLLDQLSDHELLAEIFSKSSADVREFIGRVYSDPDGKSEKRNRDLIAASFVLAQVRVYIRASNDRRRELEMRVADLELRVQALVVREPFKYMGVHESEQDYVTGQFVTHRGSLWHCNNPTRATPGEGTDWTLAVKRGRNGREQ
jgi:hypothetical protein